MAQVGKVGVDLHTADRAECAGSPIDLLRPHQPGSPAAERAMANPYISRVHAATIAFTVPQSVANPEP